MASETMNIAVHHGGDFWHGNNNTMYLGVTVTFVDRLDPDQFCFIDMLDMVARLAKISKGHVINVHYLIPEKPLKEGLRKMENDIDILDFVEVHSGRGNASLYVTTEDMFAAALSKEISNDEEVVEVHPNVKGYTMDEEHDNEEDDPPFDYDFEYEEQDDSDELDCGMVPERPPTPMVAGLSDNEAEGPMQGGNEAGLSDYEPASDYEPFSDEDESRFGKEVAFDMNVPEFKVGQRFIGVKQFREALQEHAIFTGCNLRREKNEKVRATVYCAGEGCTWRLHASVEEDV